MIACDKTVMMKERCSHAATIRKRQTIFKTTNSFIVGNEIIHTILCCS